MFDPDTYNKALKDVADGFVPEHGYDVLRMIADGHATPYFKRATAPWIRCQQPDRYFLLLTDAGKAALRAFGTWPK